LHRGLSPDSSDGLAIRAGGRSPLLAWSRRAQWKLPAGGFLSPSKTLLELSLGQSLANLVLSLRLFGLEGWAGDNSYRIVLLYSRLLSARLYQEKGLLCDPGDLDGLLTAHRSAFPESHAELAGPLESALALRPEDLNAISQTSCFRRHYPAYRRLLDSLLEGREGAALLL
jgi:hypothetical protein